MKKISEQIVFPPYYHDVSVILSGTARIAWLSTDSEGEGLYWNLPDGQMLEATPDDMWEEM
jgi:hypothetical protein